MKTFQAADAPVTTQTTKRDEGHAGSAPRTPLKAVFVKTFGCQMNVYDSERMMEALARDGYAETSDVASADLVILNTCHIREKAAEKVYSELGRLKQLKDARSRDGRSTVIAVTGCVAQAEGREITARQPAVDLVIGPQSYHRLPGLIARLGNGEAGLVDIEFADDDKFKALPERTQQQRTAAFLTVQEGCDKFCTFCVVPYTRGVEVSRTVADIEKEAVRLVQSGVRELTLLGQNVNAFHGAGPDGRAWSLARLIAKLSEIEGLERLRYMTSHPRDMSDDLIEAHGANPKLMPFLHLPVQSGSDRILAAMNRKHTAAEYVDLVRRIRAARPEIALSSDFIVGFPGETDADFDATLALVREMNFAMAFSFKYSARPGTPAATAGGQVSEAVKDARLAALKELLEAQQAAFNAQMVGSVVPVLFERPGRHAGQLVGRSPYLQAVHAEAAPELAGRIVPVRITSATQVSLGGVIQPA